jgi:outer membrane protein assembly factor BamB
MFRGNPTRTFYGTGPLETHPVELWRYPEAPMCRSSTSEGETKVWCGLGWTGQPVVWERPDGVVEVIFGAYDGAVHFVDAETGADLRPPFPTGDIIKGSVTLDPDGFPLLYFGSRDNKLRILALDRDVPTLLWSLDAGEVRGIWNNDWDANPVIVDDILYEGGENGWFFAYQLNRRFSEEGLVEVTPVQLLAIPGYDSDLIAKSGRNLSIENSPVVYDQRVYFANSGGRVVGLDVSGIREGVAPIVFDYWAGGDIDATMVVDAEGFLYVPIEHEPSEMGPEELARSREVGQLVKLDPYTDGDPRVWGIDLTDGSFDAGLWSTPALYQGLLYVNTQSGELLVVETGDGEIVWREEVGWHSWSSPVVIGDVLVVATCTGELRGYDLADPRSPERLWTLEVGAGCVEATPAVWEGTIYLGFRDGYLRAFR